MAFQLPIGCLPDAGGGVGQDMTGKNLMHILENAFSIGLCGAEAKDFAESFAVHLCGKIREGKDALDFGGEEEGLAERGIKQGFDAEAVTDEDQLLRGILPEGEGEDAIEGGEEGKAAEKESLQDDLGVTGGFEESALPKQLFAKGGAVIDFSVKDNGTAAATLPGTLAHHGLRAALGIEDGEADVGEADVPLQVDAVPVRAAVLLHSAHGLQYLVVFPGILPEVSVEITKSGDATHVRGSFLNIVTL